MRTISTRTATGAALLVAAAVAVAGCGSKSKSSAPPTAPAVTVSVATTTPVTTTHASTTTTVPSTTGSAGSPSAVSKSCLDFAGAASKLGQAFGASGSADTEKLKAFYTGLADKAPSSIKSSFVTLADAIVKYLDELKSLNIKPGQTPSADTVQKLQQASAAFQSSDIKQASDRIQAWVKAGCHS